VSISDQVLEFLSTWKLSNLKQIRRWCFQNKTNEKVLDEILRRLRNRGLLSCVRVGKENIFFDREKTLEKRSKALRTVKPQDRVTIFRKWGLDHDLTLVDLGNQFAESGLKVYPNFEKGWGQEREGSLNLQGERIFPDLHLLNPKSTNEVICIEWERNLKSKSRYADIWLTYEQDLSVQCVIYIAEKPGHLRSIADSMKKYMSEPDVRENFLLGILLRDTFEEKNFEADLEVFGPAFSHQKQIKEVLL